LLTSRPPGWLSAPSGEVAGSPANLLAISLPETTRPRGGTGQAAGSAAVRIPCR
jgi:hypothetical protein